jgi:hypothetical protein
MSSRTIKPRPHRRATLAAGASEWEETTTRQVIRQHPNASKPALIQISALPYTVTLKTKPLAEI